MENTDMKAILRKGKSFRGTRRLRGRRVEQDEAVALDTVEDYIYLLEAHGDKFELQPPPLYRRISKHGQERTVQRWEVRRYVRDAWRLKDYRPTADADKVLVIRNMGLGDVLMVTSNLRRWPGTCRYCTVFRG